MHPSTSSRTSGSTRRRLPSAALLKEKTYGCLDCQLQNLELAGSLDQLGRNPLAYTPWPVNTASGSLTETATDLRLAGPGIASPGRAATTRLTQARAASAQAGHTRSRPS